MDYELPLCFAGGLAFANGVPHFIRGVTGTPFQSPFARPPGKGLSSSQTNVIWGIANFVASWLLLFRAADFNLADDAHALAFGIGLLATGVALARHFGQYHGGNPKSE